MFLSSILKTYTQSYNNLNKYLKLNMYIKKINKKVFFNQLDEKNQLKKLPLVYNNVSFIESPNLIKYIISINLLKKILLLQLQILKENLNIIVQRDLLI